MDALDNLIFATLQSPLQTGPILSDNIPLVPPFGGFAPGNTTPAGIATPVFNFSVADKEVYSSFQDYSVIETSIIRHWYDINGNGLGQAAGSQYNWPGLGVVSDFTNSSTYHLFYAYLLENTRMLQIFEKVIEKYLVDEEFGIALPNVIQWMLNSEKLFFNSSSSKPYNVRSLLRHSYNSTRRNAYYRMFGVDLAFGDINSGGEVSYYKAKNANQQFIPLFERYLAEIWQGYINARNTSGSNSSDVNNLVELATQIQELLAARRGNANPLVNRNLSWEEFSAVILVTWFTFIISANTGVVNFLNCQSSTIGERLLKIGAKVGIPAHSKCQALFEMAGAAANILNLLERGTYLDNTGSVQTMLSSLNPGTLISIDSDYMNYFLVVINNWEKATGHMIKNPETKLNGKIKVEQKYSAPVLAHN
jgi:hypothetical protein